MDNPAFSDPDYRDGADLHQQMILTRQVPPDIVAAWQTLNDQILAQGGIPYPPPWAYTPYGRLLETPCMPYAPGFQPEPITPDDLEELKLELQYGFRTSL